jgi:hypothetical protein
MGFIGRESEVGLANSRTAMQSGRNTCVRESIEEARLLVRGSIVAQESTSIAVRPWQKCEKPGFYERSTTHRGNRVSLRSGRTAWQSGYSVSFASAGGAPMMWKPASTWTFSPVMPLARSLRRNMPVLPTSSAVMLRRRGAIAG